jgi:hypothetical protein
VTYLRIGDTISVIVKHFISDEIMERFLGKVTYFPQHCQSCHERLAYRDLANDSLGEFDDWRVLTKEGNVWIIEATFYD